MKDAYIVKKSVKRSPLNPKELVSYDEFKHLVENSKNLIWSENTKLGKRWHERHPKLKKETTAYLKQQVIWDPTYYRSIRFISPNCSTLL